MPTITIANQKGGSAKTTTAISLGAGLAQLGKRVLMVDMDPQGHLAEGVALPAVDPGKEISAVLDNKVPLADIIVPARVKLDLAPANIQLSYLEAHLWTRFRREDRLRCALQPVAPEYDFVLVDSPPSLGLLTVNALAAADYVLIPMVCEFFSLLGVGLLLQTIQEMRREIHLGLDIIGLLPTRYSRTINAREVLEQTRAELGHQLRIFDIIIPETVRFREAAGLGKTIFEHAPGSPGAEAYCRLAEEVIRHG